MRYARYLEKELFIEKYIAAVIKKEDTCFGDSIKIPE